MLVSPGDFRHFTAPLRQGAGSGSQAPEPASRTFSPSAGEIPARRVLVVDDEALLRWSLSEMLAAAGYLVVEARDAAEARRAFGDRTHPLDAILLDLKLPDANGILLIGEARRHGVACPVVLMTAYGTADTVDTALTAGAVRVVSKPFDLDDMVRYVRQICPPGC